MPTAIITGAAVVVSVAGRVNASVAVEMRPVGVAAVISGVVTAIIPRIVSTVISGIITTVIVIPRSISVGA
jgi:hypothetical protein